MSESYQLCLKELADRGLVPAGRQRAAVRARRAAPLDLFAKSSSTPTGSHSTNEFDRLLDELCAFLDRRDQRAAQVRAGRQREQEFSKALRTLDAVHKSYLKPIVVLKSALTQRPRPAETIAKAFAVLRGGALTADQRGRLMLGLSGVADQFVKAHPLIADLADIKAKLDRALASGHAGDAAPVIREALALIGRGSVTAADHMRLSLLLNEISHKLETGNAQKD